MTLLEPPFIAPPETRIVDVQVLLVEDEETTRTPMANLLERRGILVVQAGTAGEALERTLEARASVVLMDIQMGKNTEDGIDISQKIMEISPESSIIFVTAYGSDPHYRERTQDARLRVAGWFDKPVGGRLEEVVKVIRKEIGKIKAKFSLESAVQKGIALPDRLRELLREDPSLSPEVVDEILDDLDTRKNVGTDGGIRLLYAALEHFTGHFAEDPALRRRTEPLLARLEVLEQREADEFEKDFAARFRVKPGELSELYEWGRSLLEE